MAGVGYAQSGTPQLGTWGIAFEPASSPGRQLIFQQDTIAATQSASNQPLGSTGVHLTARIEGVVAGASATITIAGLAADGVTVVTETTTAISLSTVNANGIYEYTTKKAFGSINTNGITASSVTSNALTNALLTCFGSVAAKFLVPATALFHEEYEDVSPADLRGLLDEDVRMLQTIKKVTADIKSALYPESCEYLALACIGNVTSPNPRASFPASPTILKASASITSLGASYTLTTAPTSPGMMLQFVLSGNAVAGTFTVTGTNPLGQTLTEVVNITAATPNGTFYTASQNVYNTVTSIVISGFTGAALLVTQGVQAYNPAYNPTNQLISLGSEWYSGLESSVIPWCVFESFELNYDVQKELTLSLKGRGQTKLTVGDRTPANIIGTNFGTYVQPTDFPIPGWGGLFYLDPINGTLGNTQWLDVLTLKIKGTTGQTPYYTATGSQDYSRVGRKKRKMEFDAEIDFTNVLLYDAYKAFQKQQLLIKFQSKQAYLGNNSGVPIYKTMQWTLYPRILKFELDPKDEHVMGKLTGTIEYEPSVGMGFNVSFINQNNPNYAN